jgi:hypothetical protein
VRILPGIALALGLALGAGDPPPQLAAARALLDGGQAAPALEKAKEGLEFAPDHVELLDLASRAAAESGAKDEALWYGALTAEALADLDAPSKAEKAIADALPKRLLEIDPLAQQGAAAVSAYAAALAGIGKDCSGKRLYVNAVDLLDRCRGTASAPAAEAELAKIYANKKAVEALIESGLDVPVQAKRKRSAESIAKEDAKHSTWETAHEVKGKQYTIKTDMGLELAESMSLAMEQMNAFYRKVFHVKEFGGGQTARATICVYKSREEFDANEGSKDDPIDPNVAGFFRPGANYVATYDPRSDERSFAFLWETLFHESSHQFTHLISADLIPAWLNEGTASYFEGARLRSTGIIETNLVPEERLEALEAMLRMTEAGGGDDGREGAVERADARAGRDVLPARLVSRGVLPVRLGARVLLPQLRGRALRARVREAVPGLHGRVQVRRQARRQGPLRRALRDEGAAAGGHELRAVRGPVARVDPRPRRAVLRRAGQGRPADRAGAQADRGQGRRVRRGELRVGAAEAPGRSGGELRAGRAPGVREARRPRRSTGTARP